MAIIYIILYLKSSDIGWYGYDKWKYRRNTYGDKIESIKRNVFVKDLQYSKSIDTCHFEVFIEKGYRFGKHSSNDTKFVDHTKYPYQISFTNAVGKNNISYYIINNEILDSVGQVTGFLKKPYIKDTLLIGIQKYNKSWDSIGYIKVWDRLDSLKSSK